MNGALKPSFEKIGIGVPEILLPEKGVDMTKWSVIACDQYTSQPEYWEDVERITRGSPSTFGLIFPEVYLDEADCGGRIEKINSTMDSYIGDGTITPLKPGFVLVERLLPGGGTRYGLVVAVDLESYEYTCGAKSLIRATEATVLERLPPRVRIREGAALELPHIMLLIDDGEKTVIKPLLSERGGMEKLYDFELMKNGGHIKGYAVNSEELLSSIRLGLEKLALPEEFRRKYRVGPERGVLLFAVGDGNHSLAAAKAHWESLKASLPSAAAAGHPARYALAEVVNLHDDGLRFHPIHRVLFNVSPEALLNELAGFYSNAKGAAAVRVTSDQSAGAAGNAGGGSHGRAESHVIPFVSADSRGSIVVDNPACNLAVGTLQTFLDRYCAKNPGVRTDYIHGDDVVLELGSKKGNMGFFLPALNKHDLFRTIILEGVLPRKTFSMGEAEEKRYYLESRGIRL